jgi:putative Mg2+ transporter-C (MgtC) family protein
MTWGEAVGLWDVTLRLGAATVIGGALGMNRVMRGKPAGLRTLALVSLGSALLTLVGADLVTAEGRPDEHAFSRVVQGIIAGIGFLGAGAILRDEARQSVQGLTTAATVWVAASLGVACGVGFWRVALAALVLTLAVLILGGTVERLLNRAINAVMGGESVDPTAPDDPPTTPSETSS